MPYPRKILAIKLRSLGDTILMTAPLLELKAAYPDAEIHALVTARWAPLLENHPAVDRIISHERHKEATSRAKALARLAFKLRKEHYEYVVCFHASPSSATLAFATGARTRSIHFHGHRDKNRYSTVVVPGKGTLKPIIERDMDTVRALGLEIASGVMPRIFLRDVEKEAASQRFERLALSGPVLGIGLGASRPVKSWPVDRFAALAVSWCQRTSGSAVAFMSAEEQELGHAFLKSVDDALSVLSVPAPARASVRSRIICEQDISLRQVASMISQCAVFAGNDSGPRHLAVAVGTPTVTLFGPEDPFEWHPYPTSNNPYFFVNDLACRRDADPGMPPWCGLQICEVEQHRCMRQIGIEEVFEECKRVMGER